MKPNGFPRNVRVRKRRDFLRIQGQGQKFRTRHFLIFAAPIVCSKSRIGITVTRKIGKAVVRNRIKRLLREAFRHQLQSFPSGWDMVWIAKRNTVSACYTDVVSDMKIISRKLRTRN